MWLNLYFIVSLVTIHLYSTDQRNLDIFIEKTFLSDFEKSRICPNSFTLRLEIKDKNQYTKYEFVTMRDNSEILLELQKKQRTFEKALYNGKHLSIQSIFYLNEDAFSYEKSIISSIICHNLRVKGVIIIGNSTFFILPQAFKYRMKLKVQKETDNPFYASNYKVDLINDFSYFTTISHFHQRNIEAYLVADKTLVEKYINEENTVNYLFEVFAYLNMLSKQITATVYPVKLIFEQALNLENDVQNIDNALVKISKYRQANLTDKKHDILIFISGLSFSYYSGRTFVKGMCHYKKSVALITDFYSKSALRTASVIAHELAHSLGIDHDSVHCQCLYKSNKCIMSEKIAKSIPVMWSNCSVQALNNYNNTGIDLCLNDMPDLSEYKMIDIAKNCKQVKSQPLGFCGLKSKNWNLVPSIFEHCCNISFCQLMATSQCSSGDCCDPITCKYLSSNNICRASTNECDLTEYCTGDSNECPPDKSLDNGSSCHNDEGHCYKGICGSSNSVCQLLFGPNFKSAREECYLENMKGTSFQGHCGYKPKITKSFIEMEYQYFYCSRKDIYCGSLKCDFDFVSKTPSIQWQQSLEDINYITYEDKRKCYFGQYNTNLTGMSDPTMVPNGSPCGQNKYCVDQKCIPIPETH